MDRHTRTDLRYRLSLVAVMLGLLAAAIGLAAPRNAVMADGSPTPTPTYPSPGGGGGLPGRT
jgi:hypothetical protein